MSRNIPIRRCAKCTHNNWQGCTLEDLEPCRFKRTPEAELERAKNIYFAVCVVIALASSFLLWYFGR
jgi:hypothetical protein